jgi:hypothetical protein
VNAQRQKIGLVSPVASKCPILHPDSHTDSFSAAVRRVILSSAALNLSRKSLRLRQAKMAGSALQKLLLMLVARRRATVLLWAVLSGKTPLLKLRSLLVLLPSLPPAVGKLLETLQDAFV